MRRPRSVVQRYVAVAALVALFVLLPMPGLEMARAGLLEYEVCSEATSEVNTRILACTRILDDLEEPPAIRTRAARERAHAHYLKGDYDHAIADYTVALQLGPAKAATHIDRGLAYEEKSDYDRAIADYTEAIRIAPDEGKAYHCRGRVHSARRQYEPAIADFTEAIRTEPGWGFSYYLRAHAYDEIGRIESAIADYRKALAVSNPYDATIVTPALRKLGAAP